MKTGFTLVELIVVMGLVALLTAVTTVNLLGGQKQAAKLSLTDQLMADLRAQQTKAMQGDNAGLAMGIYFGATSYTLFAGETYNPTDSSNYVVEIDTYDQTLGTSLPGSVVVFTPLSGEVKNYIAGLNTISIGDSVLTINKYGVVTTN